MSESRNITVSKSVTFAGSIYKIFKILKPFPLVKISLKKQFILINFCTVANTSKSDILTVQSTSLIV